MRHQQYKDRLQLMLYDELSTQDRQDIEKHIEECAECQAELEELKKFHSVLAQHTPSFVTDTLLQEARRELRGALRSERLKQSIWEKLAERVRIFTLPQYKIAFGAVGALAVGLFLGYLLFSPRLGGREIQQLPTQAAKETTQPLGGNTQITNVHFVSSDPTSGEVEFTFDAVKPVHMKGSVNDPDIQKVLAYALLNEQNPGVRLRSVDAIGSEQLKPAGAERDIKRTLIAALKSDKNPGVRKEALAVLQKFPFDEEVKQAFLDVLMYDANSGLRIAAINALEDARGENLPLDPEVLKVFKQKMQSDDNNYIRLRARAVVEEMKQQ
jgi:reverse gyrase